MTSCLPRTVYRRSTRTGDTARIAALAGKLRSIDDGQVEGAVFIDQLVAHCRLKNVADLARRCALSAALLSKVRHGQLRVSARVLLAMHDGLGIEIAALKDMLGNPSCAAPQYTKA